MNEIENLRKLFVKYLTKDSETQDIWRRDFNQAIFDEEDGWACCTNTDLSMVLDKFDMAVEELQRKKEEVYKYEKKR